MTPGTGVAGRLAAAFVDSKLTPLFVVGSLLLGLMAVVALPREEEPQIVVPMLDVFVEMPGASPAEVEQRVTRPLEQLIFEIAGVEYVYSTSSPGAAMIVVRFYVGEDEERALVRVNQRLAANAALMPPGASPPLVQQRSIDDVPILAATLSSSRYDDFALRQVAGELAGAIKEVPDVAAVTIIGGAPRAVTIELDPARLAAYHVDPLAVSAALQRSNVRQWGADFIAGDRSAVVQAGSWLTSVDEVRDVVVGASGGAVVRLGDVASVSDGDAEPTSYVRFHHRDGTSQPAVTLAVSKRAGTNAIGLTRRIEAQLEGIRGRLVPSDVALTITRNYGETASEKSNELLSHMLLAVLSVSGLIWLALGRREAAVVLIAIPVTLALTLFTFFLYGYTLNRITLFALIFSIGILVDDAIVVVENVVRHARSATGERRGLVALTIRAVDEVGNPTILATLTVIAAILPMAFVGGLMGPYMRPIPVGASAAMLFSLVVAFVVTPWAAVRLLHGAHDHDGEREDRLTVLYRRAMRPLIANARVRAMFLGGVAVLLLLAIALVPLQLVTVKMLPFDNKSEFQVVIEAPEGTPLEETARAASALAAEALEDPDVTSVQSYAGTAAPYNFNGLVRHYFLRQAPHQADLQVNLRSKSDRREQSHDIAKRLRAALTPMAADLGVRVQVAEVPPGPPVLQTLVAEVYGPEPERRLEVAREVRTIFERTPGVVDVDWYVEDARPRQRLEVDEEKAARSGVSAAMVASLVRMAGAGERVGLLHDPHAREAVPILMRLPREARASPADLLQLRLQGKAGVSLAEVARLEDDTVERSLYRKNMLPVTYVIGDVAGEAESPVYAIRAMNEELERLRLPDGYGLDVFSATAPPDSARYAMKWDGEWHITYEVFRDLGLAFGVVLLLIYILVVGWFQSFVTPMTIMVAIPFSLAGILPAHALMGAFFTATSMIGFIAGAGIVVRNSIILVDFIELRLREGMPLAEAVVDAGAVRFRPMALTAAAVIVGAGVILFDPIFQGLAISLMAGEVASLLLSRMTVPVMYYVMNRRGPATA